MMGKINRYTEEQKEWLKENYANMPMSKLVESFNKHFNDKRTYEGIRCCCKDILGLRRGYHLKPSYADMYTPEEIEWIVNHSHSFSRTDLAKEFNEKFNHRASYKTVAKICLGFGGARKCVKEIKPLQPYVHKRVEQPDRMLIRNEDGVDEAYARYLYRKHYGKIPKGYVVIHLDGNHMNNDINNLEAVSRAELNKLLGGKSYGLGEITRTEIMIHELKNLIEEE